MEEKNLHKEASVMEETKEQRFIRVAEPRVNRACKAIYLLGNLASPGYSYSDEQVEAMFAAVQESLDNARAAFQKREKKPEEFHFKDGV